MKKEHRNVCGIVMTAFLASFCCACNDARCTSEDDQPCDQMQRFFFYFVFAVYVNEYEKPRNYG